MNLFQSQDVEAINVAVAYNDTDSSTVSGSAALTKFKATWDSAIAARHKSADAAEIGGSEKFAWGVSNLSYPPIMAQIPNP